jgi:hypothetical protein
VLGAGRQVRTPAAQGGFCRAFAPARYPAPARAWRRPSPRAPLAGNVIGKTAGAARAHAGHCM